MLVPLPAEKTGVSMKKAAVLIGAGIAALTAGAFTIFVLEMVDSEEGFYNPNSH
jgi:uncharacterized protein involved in exopolysaccharide biosynthesis